MKKVFSVFSLLLLFSFFLASCGGSSTNDSADTETGADTGSEADTDSGSTDTQPADTGSECGNQTTEVGEACDSDAKECSEIDPSYTGGYAICKTDCSGYDFSGCNGGQNPDPADSGDSGDTTPGGDTDPDTTDTTPGPVSSIEFERFVADDNPNKPAFVTVDDLDNDGNLDMIVAQYGPMLSGNYDIYWGTGKLDQWTKETLNIGGNNGISFPHPVKVLDVNGDGIKDIVSPSGFLACVMNCGNIFWLEGSGERNKWTKHELITNNDHFFFDVSLVDVDGDGKLDILSNASKKSTLGGMNERLLWLKGNDTDDRFEKTATVISEGNGGPFPRFVDLNGDGKKDIALAQYFNKDTSANGSFIWFEQTDDIEKWTKHIIDNESGESFMLEFIDNLYGDGVRRAVGVNHVNTTDNPNGPKEGVFIFDIPEDPTQPWPKKNIATDIQSRKSPLTGPQAAPGLFGYGDITGNGLIDLVVSGDGDSRVFWFEQNPAGTFTQHTLDGVAGADINSAGSFGQAGGMQIVDLDGDGTNEIIVTLYEDNKLYIYKIKK